MFNHLEYDATSLNEEYERDVAANRPIRIPGNYFPDDDPCQPPVNPWRAAAHLLFQNWITEIYEGTPYVLEEIGTLPRS